MKNLKALVSGVAILVFGNLTLKAQSVDVSSNTTETSSSLKKKAVEEEKTKLKKPYDPKANAAKDIERLVAKAKKENKNIILQAGGNWCVWCLRFNHFIENTPELKSIVDKNFLYYHLNYSPDNKNESVFAKYDHPGEKYGYPVFIVLDKNGKMIHIQDSAVLEEDKGYGVDKVVDFFTKWAPKS